jgi:hypothetical protein
MTINLAKNGPEDKQFLEDLIIMGKNLSGPRPWQICRARIAPRATEPETGNFGGIRSFSHRSLRQCDDGMLQQIRGPAKWVAIGVGNRKLLSELEI